MMSREIKYLGSLLLLAFPLFLLLAFALHSFGLGGFAGEMPSPPSLDDGRSVGRHLLLSHLPHSPVLFQPALLSDVVALDLEDSIIFL